MGPLSHREGPGLVEGEGPGGRQQRDTHIPHRTCWDAHSSTTGSRPPEPAPPGGCGPWGGARSHAVSQSARAPFAGPRFRKHSLIADEGTVIHSLSPGVQPPPGAVCPGWPPSASQVTTCPAAQGPV